MFEAILHLVLPKKYFQMISNSFTSVMSPKKYAIFVVKLVPSNSSEKPTRTRSSNQETKTSSQEMTKPKNAEAN